jgi:Ni/Fe-hydrogenase subunit HybB-like protein
MLYWIIIAATVLLSVMAGLVFLKQLRSGLSTTALHDTFNWGLYIQGFFYLSAMAGGILVFVAVATLFEIEAVRRLVEIGAAVSLSCLICAGALIGADLGKPFRGMKILTGKNFASPMTWDFFMLPLCGVLNIVFLLGIIPASGVLKIVWSILCLVAALAYVMIHTLFFLSRVGAGFRSQPFLGLDTLAQSLWGGMALMTLIAVATGIREHNLAGILLILTILALIPIAGSYIVSLTSTGSEVNSKIIFLDTFILLILIATQIVSPQNAFLPALASVLILVAVFLEKSHLMRQYQMSPTVPFPYSQFDEVPSYKPTAAEWMLVLGSLGACVWLSSGIIYLKTLVGGG